LEHRLSESSKHSHEQQRRILEEILMFLEKRMQMLANESFQAIEEIKEEVERLLTREMLNRKMKRF